MNRLVVIAAVVLVSATAVFCQRSSTVEQTRFSAEEEIQSPAKVPAGVLTALQRDGDVLRCLSEEHPLQQAPQSWFSASVVTLTTQPRTGLVVKPENGCLFGANIVPFWIFEQTPNGYRLDLKIHALSVEILNSRTNDHSDIETDKASVTTVYSALYKFKNDRYEVARSGSKPIR